MLLRFLILLTMSLLRFYINFLVNLLMLCILLCARGVPFVMWAKPRELYTSVFLSTSPTSPPVVALLLLHISAPPAPTVISVSQPSSTAPTRKGGYRRRAPGSEGCKHWLPADSTRKSTDPTPCAWLCRIAPAANESRAFASEPSVTSGWVCLSRSIRTCGPSSDHPGTNQNLDYGSKTSRAVTSFFLVTFVLMWN